MFVCGDCGAAFEKPLRSVERHGLDTPPYEELDVCPSCYGMCILEALFCDGCDAVITERYIELDNGARFCSECYAIKNI